MSTYTSGRESAPIKTGWSRFTSGCYLCLALILSSIFDLPSSIRAQTILTADGLAAFGTNAPAAGGGGGSAFPSDSIVLNWKFNGDATDSSGNGNNGTVHGTTFYTTDETGAATHALHLDGSTAYVDAASVSVANFTSGDFSFVAYCTNNAADFSSGGVLLGNGVFADHGYFFQVHLAFSGNSLAATPEFLWLDAGGTHTIQATDRSMSAVTANYCLVFVRSGTSGKIYVNGTNVTAGSQPTIGTITASSTTKFTVGKYLGNSNFFPGNVQQIIVYSRALTPTEVATGSAGTSQ
jgi:hypothetical protein